jgi:putative MATE family efflux protein
LAQTKNLLEGDIATTLRELSVPMGVGVVFMILVNLVDTYWASRLGTDALAAMSFAFPVIGVVMNVSLGLMIGTSVAVARVIGAGDEAEARRLAAHSILLGFGIVALVTSVGLATQDQLFAALGAPAELLPVIRAYMAIWFGSAVVLVVPMMLNGILRARGDARTPRNVMILAAGLNAIFDPILIFGLGPIPALGLEGAAWATALSRFITFLYAFRIAVKLETLDLHIPTPRELWRSWSAILRVGLPATMTNVLGPVATAMVTAIVAMHGAAAVAAYGIGARVESLVLIAPMALSSGLSPFVGQNFGAHLNDRVAKGFRMSLRFSVLWGLGALALLLPAAPWIASIFTSEPDVQRDIVLYLRIVPLGYAAYGAMTMVSASFNAMDHALRSTALSVIRSIAVAVPAAWLGSELFGLSGAFAGLALGSLVGAVLGVRWMKMFLDPEIPVRADGPKALLHDDADLLIAGTAAGLRERMKALVDTLRGLEDVELHQVRADAVGFFVGTRQIGHIHPSGHVDLPLPFDVGEVLVANGVVEPHRMHEGAGWYTHRLQDADDLDRAQWLLRLGHGLTRLFCHDPPTPEGRSDLDDLNLDDALRAALDRSKARWLATRRGSASPPATR